MNRFELRFVPYTEEELYEQPDRDTDERPEIWVDGQLLDEPWRVDLRALIGSLIEPGEHFILTCQCTLPDCARIYKGFEVSHEGELIRWKFRRPVSQNRFWSDEDYMARSTAVDYVFPRSDFASVEAMDWYQQLYPSVKRIKAIWALARKQGLSELTYEQFKEFERRVASGAAEHERRD